MQDAIAGFQAAPFWAQVAMVFFAITAVAMLAGPTVRKRKFRGRFNDIARGIGAEPPAGDWPVTARTTVGGRTFAVTYDFRGGKNPSYRGPRGYLLTTSTRLAGSRWPLHQVDVRRIDSWVFRLVKKRLPRTGDPAFDARFLVVEDGLPVRAGWLTAETRQALSRFMDDAPARGVLWIHEGELQYVMSDPWTGMNGPAARALLERQAVLALALDRAGG